MVKALDFQQIIDVIYFDFRKTFDTVAHARLAHKFYAYGIRGSILNWIKSFLKDRKRKVVAIGEEFSWSDVLSGIPQGSVLAPALFLAYVNDLPDSITSFVKIFADDTKVYSTISTTSDNDSIMVQNGLTTLSDWSDI